MNTKALNQSKDFLLGVGLDILHRESTRMARNPCLLERRDQVLRRSVTQKR